MLLTSSLVKIPVKIGDDAIRGMNLVLISMNYKILNDDIS